ncbi:MAG: DUF2064 domain-containing protein [Chitinophagales bacterium]
MKDNCLKTAILLFTRTPYNAESTKNLALNVRHKEGDILVKILGQHFLQTAEATGMPVYRIETTNLKGVNFGSKLLYGFDKLFEMNYEQVIVIGNDYLHISTEMLVSAQNLLSTKDVIIGPTFDGGSYLFGCSKDAYLRTNLLELRWGTNHLFEDMVMNAAIDDLKVGFLPTEIVMDTPSDFQLCLQKYPPFESMAAQIEDTLDAFESSVLQYELSETIDSRIFYTPPYVLDSLDEGEVFCFCLN